MVRVAGSGPDHSPLAKLRWGDEKAGARTTRFDRRAKEFNRLGAENFFGERQIRAVKFHREPLRARPLPAVRSEMVKRAT
jgi:hypothetical protein